jgi:prevent-host-death family protein
MAMDEPISAAEANRNFSQLLRGVREEGTTYVVTSHGKPVAKLVPVDDEGKSAAREAAKKRLLKHLRAMPVVKIGRWTRDELYERD